ncbi:MAG: nicotinamide-nucleotide amidohydrolase family protein [Alphaproteobacteria bacterium]|nr:nicotinamide-nucleotide amidohydrolase family protein [Alphaproteobacteria bacterium]
MIPAELLEKANHLLEICEGKKLMVATVESCTGGLLAGCLTAVPGSSAVVERGFVTYSNEAKTDLAGVDPTLIERHGAVSREVAAAMATGALQRAPVDLAVSVTGVAGPGGGTAAKPVGLVFIGAAARDGPVEVTENHFPGDRNAIREASISVGLDMLITLAETR